MSMKTVLFVGAFLEVAVSVGGGARLIHMQFPHAALFIGIVGGIFAGRLIQMGVAEK